MIYPNGLPVALRFPDAAQLTQPLMRLVPTPSRSGLRAYTAGRAVGGLEVRLYVTGRGHHYRSDDERDALHNDRVCRGCGHHGHFDYILDYKRCPQPPSAQDIARALLESVRRPAPARMRSRSRIRFIRTEVAA